MWHFLASFLILLACGFVSLDPDSLAFLAEDVSLASWLISLLCLMLFLLGVAVAVSANTGAKGELHSPQTLSGLMCLILLVPQGGFALGTLVNVGAYLEITSAARDSAGTMVYTEQGVAVLDGEVGHETLSTLQSVLEFENPSFLILRSEGGLIDIGIEIGEILRRHRMDVFVPENCESACVIIALSGEQLYVAPDALFGFHRGSAITSNDSQLGRFIGEEATEQYLQKLGDLGVPESILAIAKATPPNEMHYITAAEMVSIGLAQYQSDFRR